MRISEHHESLSEDGRGRCSVPMWSFGCPAGFCDQEAFGVRPDGVTVNRWDGVVYREDGRYSGYVPALACPHHGGPDVRLFKDGNKRCAVRADFENLQESAAGFGDTRAEAVADLEAN